MFGKNFIENKKGIFAVVAIGITIMFVATLVWLVVIFVSTQFVDTFSAMTGVSAVTIALGNQELIMGSIVIVVLDVGIVIWFITSSFKRESQEDISGVF